MSNTRAPKLLGDFGEGLIIYLLIRKGFEVAYVDQESLRCREYYASPRNAFWPIMEAMFGIPAKLPTWIGLRDSPKSASHFGMFAPRPTVQGVSISQFIANRKCLTILGRS